MVFPFIFKAVIDMEAVIEKAKIIFEDAVKDKRTLIKIMSVIIILLLALIFRIHGSSKPDVTIESSEALGAEAAESDASEDTEDAGEYALIDNLYVDISGAVNSPGVYSVSKQTRLYEVVEMAGGLTEAADINSINQASFVEDGEKIIIPAKGEALPDAAEGEDTAAAAASSSGLVNINFASKEELKTLNGIGDVTADKIIEYRNSNKFKNKEDIKSVKGIGDGIYEKIKDKITC